MNERGPARPDHVERSRGRLQRAPPASMKVAEENDAAAERAKDGSQRRTVGQAVSELNQAGPRVDRGMVDQDDSGALVHEGCCRTRSRADSCACPT